jgi:hypothetical protein
VLEAAAGDEGIGILQRLDDGVVGVALVAVVLEHALAFEARSFTCEGAVGVDSEGDGGVDAACDQVGLVGHPDLEVIATVARGGVHEARAILVRDVIAVEEGDVEAVASVAQGMGASQTGRIDVGPELEGVDFRRLHDGLGELLGQNEPVAHLGPVAFGRLGGFVKAVLDL